MKRYLILLLSLFFAVPLAAQSRREALLEYQARRRQAYAEFQDNYRKACADFMRKRWEAFRSEAPVPLPERKEPPQPVVKQPDESAAPTQDRIPYKEVVEAPVRTVPAIPATPAAPEVPGAPEEPDGPKAPDAPAEPKLPGTKKDGDRTPPAATGKGGPAPAVVTSRPCRFTFYGTECSVSLAAKHRFKLASLQENSVADAWERVAGGAYDPVAKECRELKEQLRLNDWGYYALVRTLSDGFFGKQSAESVVLQSFLMAEAGCKVRLARGGDRLCLLLALDDQVYAKPYFKIDGQTFYLMDFYTDYPPCYWSIYAATELTPAVRDQLYPTLRSALAGKGEYDAANLLLHYLHRAFPYKTDEAQFGVERTLFAEEMFHYPYSDCEDRSILFARLVRDLMKLDVVLLYYPEHIATAVCFKEDVKGDYMQIGAGRYVVCDPTYVGADVGDAMPDLKRVAAQVVKID